VSAPRYADEGAHVSSTPITPSLEGAYQSTLPTSGGYAGLNLDQAREYGLVVSDSDPSLDGLSADARDVLKLSPGARGNGAADSIARGRASADAQSRLAELQKNIDALSSLANEFNVDTGSGLGLTSHVGLTLQANSHGLTASPNVLDEFVSGFSNDVQWSVLQGDKPVSYALGGAMRTASRAVFDGLTGAGDFQAADRAFDRGDYVEGGMYALRGVGSAGLTVMTAGEYTLAKAAVGGVIENTTVRSATRGASDYGVSFFGDSNLPYYTRETATIGRDAKPFFLPLEDSGVVQNAADAARYTGRAPSAEQAYMDAKDIFGLSFPTDGMKVSVPSAADAGGWPHFLEGGRTAVRLGDGPGAGYLVNPTREFVVPGGNTVPAGSVLFKLGPNGEWIPLRRF
jgi:hypothetical protein